MSSVNYSLNHKLTFSSLNAESRGTSYPVIGCSPLEKNLLYILARSSSSSFSLFTFSAICFYSRSFTRLCPTDAICLHARKRRGCISLGLSSHRKCEIQGVGAGYHGEQNGADRLHLWRCAHLISKDAKRVESAVSGNTDKQAF